MSHCQIICQYLYNIVVLSSIQYIVEVFSIVLLQWYMVQIGMQHIVYSIWWIAVELQCRSSGRSCWVIMGSM